MIYLVRHGQTDWNVERKTQGHTDIPLNENGKNQAHNLSDKISNFKIDKIISSDLLRAKETAEIINEKFNVSIECDKRLREMNYGDLEGVCRDELTPDIWEIFNNKPDKLHAEHIESVFDRVKSFFDELNLNDENILIVTHGGTLRMIMYYANYKDKFDKKIYMENFQHKKIKNADILEWKDEIKIV